MLCKALFTLMEKALSIHDDDDYCDYYYYDYPKGDNCNVTEKPHQGSVMVKFDSFPNIMRVLFSSRC